jgi:predicted dehydrogenase
VPKTTGSFVIPLVVLLVMALGIGSSQRLGAQEPDARRSLRIVTLDPGHFHAALPHRETYPDVDPRVNIYAPLGPDLIEHLKRVGRFNLRPENPTAWRLEVHTSPDFLDRFRKERAGNVVVISGRNRGKIDYVQAAIGAGFHALVDKPWILRSEDLPKLEAVLGQAENKRRIAFDMMTERFEITTILQKELVQDPEIFGTVQPGSADRPAVYMESVHHLMKTVAGAPNLRPTWFFDREQQGEGVNDIGTHLVDLIPWTLWPGQGVDPKREIQILSSQRWPTLITRANFQRVTGEKDFPADLRKDLKDDTLEYFCNTLVTYTVRGVHTKLNIIWDWEAPAGTGDSHYAYYRGTRARIEVRQGKAEGHRPETYVVPNEARDHPGILVALGKRLGALQSKYPGVSLEQRAADILIKIPDRLRTTHEEHFAEVARAFFGYVKNPKTFPAWEKQHMLAKYHVTTRAADLSREGPVKVANRIAPR